MRNEEAWKPSKFIKVDEKIFLNKHYASFPIRSWVVTECTAISYNRHAAKYLKGSILDIGCGLCPFYGLYKSNASSIFCIDWPNSYHASPYTDLECDITQHIPLESSTFDSILLSDVLEHISKPETLLSEIHRLLTVNGYLVFNVPFLYWIHEQPYDFYRYTEYGLRLLLENASFKLEVIEPVGGALETWSDLTIKLSSYFPIIKYIIPWILFNSAFKLSKISFVKAKFEQLDLAFPLGYFVVARKV